MTDPESDVENEVHRTLDGVEYTPHSMMHKAIVCMDPTKLEMLEGFNQINSGHKFTPDESNVRVIVSGREWSEKRILIYGSKSTKEAREYVNTIINRVTEIGHDAELVSGPEITNIAVSGDLGTPLQLETLCRVLRSQEVEFEYEPEQFPATIVRIQQPQVTFLLFSTGKFVIQSVKNFNDIEPAIERIQKLVETENQN